ncbi:MAG: shikimate dehydrogenase [Christensenellaceae bacterium]
MMKNYRSKLVGVFGYPIDENPTIVMMEAAFCERSIDWRYLTLLVDDKHLKEAFIGMRAMNFEGINLTIPHKVKAIQYVDRLAKSAELIGAINTVVRENDSLVGYNTDGAGFVRGIKSQGIELRGKEIAVMGAGGASRAICVECALAGCKKISVINRNIQRGTELVELLNHKTDAQAVYIKWAGTVHIPQCDILINATNIGLYPDCNVPDIDYEDITPQMIVQDIIPNPALTPFLKKAKQKGAVIFDGLSMLVYQGEIAFKLWTGKTPNIKTMKKALEQENE